MIALSQILMMLLCADSYFDGWRYVPTLTLAAVFSGFASFAGSVYLVKKKSMLTFLTAMSGAFINIVLNLLLIPKIGAQGAAIATLASYAAVFAIRAINARRYVKFSLSPIRMSISLAVLFAQTALVLLTNKYVWIWQGACFGVIAFINMKPFVIGTIKMLKKRKKV